jgi:hypothetical protein
VGGLGSGGWYRFNKKTSTNECQSIDIRYLYTQPALRGHRGRGSSGEDGRARRLGRVPRPGGAASGKRFSRPGQVLSAGAGRLATALRYSALSLRIHP